MTKRTAMTTNGDLAFAHTGNHFVEFFSKAGSLRVDKNTKDGKDEILALFTNAFHADRLMALRLMFWVRGIREGGAGNRDAFRTCLRWLGKNEPEIASANVHLVPKYGRWDDLESLYGTAAEDSAVSLWAGAIRNQDRLACKWACRRDGRLARHLRLTPKQFRQLVVAGSDTVEQKMCAQ